MKPKPLDLEELEKNICYMIDYWNEDPLLMRNEGLQAIMRKIKLHLKSACNFYWRYRYNPELLAKEYPELKEEMIKKFGFDFAFWSEKWLFKLAFKDVFKG